MRAVRFHEYGGPDILQVDEVETPAVADGEVLVDVDGAGVNPVDTYIREGTAEPFTLPMITGIDVAGTVNAVGEAISRFEIGDPVFGAGVGKNHYGGYAEYAAVPANRLVKLPAVVDTMTAGGAGVVAVTAWRALIDHATL